MHFYQYLIPDGLEALAESMFSPMGMVWSFNAATALGLTINNTHSVMIRQCLSACYPKK